MINKIRHCIGVVSYCTPQEEPERFLRLKESILSHKSLKRDDNYMFLWDNGSSDDVKDFLNSCDFFDDIFFSHKNLYTNVMEALLNLKAKEFKAQYITLLAHDYMIYDSSAVLNCIDFMDKNLDCGYVRMLKFELDRKEIYDKMGNHPKKDLANQVTLYNVITRQPLLWEEPQFINGYRFFKNSWHWSEFPNVCRAKVFDKIFPKKRCGLLQNLESVMMKNYNHLNLKTGVLDGGAALHNQLDFSMNGSLRINKIHSDKLDPNMQIDPSEILQLINEICNTNYESL